MSAPLILVPLDGSARALGALPVAGGLRRIMAADLMLLHVSADPPAPLAQLAGRLGLTRTSLEGWSIVARVGDPASAILEEANTRNVQLIVMCTHTADARPDAVLGRTARDVLRGAPCPIVFVPPGMQAEGWRPKRVLLPYDGTPAADAAVPAAARLACWSGAELFVVQVGDYALPGPLGSGVAIMPRYVDQPQHEWPGWNEEVLARLASLCQDDVHARLCVRAGEPPQEIVRLVESPESLIVMSWNGEWHGERARTLKGVLGDAPCPVLIVPYPEARRRASGM